jgi:hypothetical protein
MKRYDWYAIREAIGRADVEMFERNALDISEAAHVLQE